MFPDIKSLSKKQRENYMIMDDQYLSFDASSNFLYYIMYTCVCVH